MMMRGCALCSSRHLLCRCYHLSAIRCLSSYITVGWHWQRNTACANRREGSTVAFHHSKDMWFDGCSHTTHVIVWWICSCERPVRSYYIYGERFGVQSLSNTYISYSMDYYNVFAVVVGFFFFIANTNSVHLFVYYIYMCTYPVFLRFAMEINWIIPNARVRKHNTNSKVHFCA